VITLQPLLVLVTAVIVVLSQVPIHGSFRNAFRNVRSVLVERFDVSHGLIDLLWRHGVLTDAHVSDIRVRRFVTTENGSRSHVSK